MKRILLTLSAALSVMTAVAQNREVLVRDVERAEAVRDSIAEELNSRRAEYLRDAARRTELGVSILTLEQALRDAQRVYEERVVQVSKHDAGVALADYRNAATSQNSEEQSQPKEQAYTPDKSRLRRNLVDNDYFVERLSEADYQTLREAQKRERVAQQYIDKYMKHYAELLALQRRYMEVATREEADSVARLFRAKQSQLTSCDEAIEREWSSIYFNKMYIYDLLMEREKNVAMLDLSASGAAAAEREINEVSDLYASNALMGYNIRKKSLVSYETALASTLSLTTARDSLRSVAAELRNRDYRLSRLLLERRSFIVYEPIEVKGTTFYNTKNPIPHTKVYDYGTIYRVRIGLFKNRPNLIALRGVTPLSYTDAYNNGLYAYFVGGFRTEQEAKDGAAELKRMGFKAPVVAVWVDGDYYPTVDDMRRSQSLYNIEISGIATLSDDVKARILTHKNDCTISRIGSTFVVGTFEGKSAAEAVAADLRSVGNGIAVEVVKKP